MKMLLLSELMVLAACTSGPRPRDFVDSDMSGKVGGREWQYRYAYTDPTVETPEEDDMVFVFLPVKPRKPCPKPEDLPGKTSTIMISAPMDKKLLKLKRGQTRSMVFQFDKKGEQFATVARAGKLKITDINDKTIKGRIFGEYNEANWVSGNFSAVVCGFADMR